MKRFLILILNPKCRSELTQSEGQRKVRKNLGTYILKSTQAIAKRSANITKIIKLNQVPSLSWEIFECYLFK